MPKLSDKQRAFVREYLKDFNATAAAHRAGYSDGNYGRQLLTNPNVEAELARYHAEAHTDAVMSAREVLESYTSIAKGEGRTEKATKQGIVELPPDFGERIRALDSLAKHHGLLAEKTEHLGDIAIRIIRE